MKSKERKKLNEWRRSKTGRKNKYWLWKNEQFAKGREKECQYNKKKKIETKKIDLINEWIQLTKQKEKQPKSCNNKWSKTRNLTNETSKRQVKKIIGETKIP